MNRIVLHVDMNAFFASVEQKLRPELRGQPIVVVGDMKRRSVILTASYEARAFGIRTGMVLHKARGMCAALVPVEGRFDVYMAASREIRTVLSGFSPQMEMASCDEAFLDVSPGAHVPVDPDRMADDVRRAVRDGVGLPCSVGAAPNKLLAKLASDMKKPDGITVIRPADVPGLMADLPVDRLCGIGRKTRDHLLRMGIRTCGELGAVPDQTLYARFGVWGQRLGRMGRGEDDAPVAYSDKDEDPKSVGHATTFPEDTRDPALVKSYLLMLCEKVGRRLRRRGLKGRVVSLTVRTADFAFQSRQAAAREATDGDVEIYRRAERIFDEMAPSMAMRLVGVTVSDLSRDDGQGFLLGDDDRRRRLAKTVDALNVKFGRMTVRHAAVDLARRKGVFRPSIPPTLSGAEDDESPG